jgi:hypothetical protein
MANLEEEEVMRQQVLAMNHCCHRSRITLCCHGMTLEQIREYQGVDDKELQEAVDQIK